MPAAASKTQTQTETQTETQTAAPAKKIAKKKQTDPNASLVVTARIKGMLNDADMNTSGDLADALTAQLAVAMQAAISNAKNSNRKTVRVEDVCLVNVLAEPAARGLACTEETTAAMEGALKELSGRACVRAEGNKRKKLLAVDV